MTEPTEPTEPTETPPPTHVMAAMEEMRESRWPKVIGIISLIYAIGGLLCQVVAGFMSLFLGEWLASLAGMELEIPTIIKVTTISVVLLTTVVGIMMVVGAARLLRRIRSGVSLLRTWAILRVVIVLIGLTVTVLTAKAQVQIQRMTMEFQNDQLRQAGRADRIQDVSDEDIWNGILRNSMIFSGLLLVYPVFLSVYLSRSRIEEESRTWI